jgi:hypothetical protein
MSVCNLQDLAKALNGQAVGDVALQVTGACEPQDAAGSLLAIATSQSYAERLPLGQARIALLAEGTDWHSLNLLGAILVPRPRFAMVGLSHAFDHRWRPGPPGIHPQACVEPGAEIGPGARIGAFCHVAAGAVLGFLTGGLLGAVGGTAAAALVENEVIELYRWNNPGEVISDQQLEDFRRFCRHIQGQTAVKYLRMGNSVPFIYINDLVETLLSELELAKEDFAHEVQDDIRDSWHSPGNRRQLSALVEILRELHRARPDIEIVNLSGDIHVANAFSAQPEGFAKPIYQVTTSPLTNRGTLSDSVVGFLSADWPLDAITSEGLFGEVRRLWQEASFQNFLEIDATAEDLRLCLRVYNRHDDQPFGARDRRLVLRAGEASFEA